MTKWLLGKIGIKGLQWFNRGLVATMLGLTGWSIWKTGRIDGIIEVSEHVEKSLNNN